jgi:hypothetical protein
MTMLEIAARAIYESIFPDDWIGGECIEAAQSDLVDIVHTLKQVVCVKG